MGKKKERGCVVVAVRKPERRQKRHHYIHSTGLEVLMIGGELDVL